MDSLVEYPLVWFVYVLLYFGHYLRLYIVEQFLLPAYLTFTSALSASSSTGRRVFTCCGTIVRLYALCLILASVGSLLILQNVWMCLYFSAYYAITRLIFSIFCMFWSFDCASDIVSNMYLKLIVHFDMWLSSGDAYYSCH